MFQTSACRHFSTLTKRVGYFPTLYIFIYMYIYIYIYAGCVISQLQFSIFAITALIHFLIFMKFSDKVEQSML